MKRLTPKHRKKVLKKFPEADAFPMLGEKIYLIAGSLNAPFDNLIGIGFTEDEAWADAARRLK